MKCPRCAHYLVRFHLKNVQIDECKNCKGTWFDRDELRKAKDSTDKDLRWLDFDVFDLKNKTSKENTIECPRCTSEMSTLEYMDSKVKIDRCNSCYGVWLDDEEFKKIISYLDNLVIKKDSSEYLKSTVEELREILSGPKDLVSEIKDFLTVVNLLQKRIQAQHPKIAEIAMTFTRAWPIR